jgi:DNA-binding LacI/PurR family transcriptional regulator
LQTLVASRSKLTWILLASTPATQAWFARAGVSALVLGSCHPGIVLPSVDIDYRAVGWHAAGLFAKYGHTRVAVLTPPQPLAGDLACKEGFADYFAQSAPDVAVVEIAAGEKPKQLCTRLDGAMQLRARPTGIFSLRQNLTLTAWLHLLQLKFAVPGDVALLSRDSHPLVDAALPGLAHYSRPVDLLAGKVIRLAQALLISRAVSTEPVRVMPEFIAGGTLGPPAVALRQA